MAALLTALLATTLTAPPQRVEVDVSGCTGLAAPEVARLLDIELSTVTAEIRSGPPLRVELSCSGSRMTITVLDPLTRKRLSRDIPAPAAEPGRERVVALAVSQLFAASWLELLTAEPPPPPPPDAPEPEPEPEAVSAAREAAKATVEAEPEPTAAQRELELLVGIGPRGRGLEQPGRWASSHTELRLRGWTTPSLGWLVTVGWDFSQGTRSGGRVRGQAATLGGGFCWGYRPGRVGVGGHVSLAAAFAQVRGLASGDEFVGARRRGPTGEAVLGVGPRIRYGRLRFDIDAEVGGMLRSPVGLVDGGPAVSMGGVFAGLSLRLGGRVR